MTEPEKHLILSVTFEDYEAYIAAHGLNPARCFQCITWAEVRVAQARNARWGIVCRVHRTPEYAEGRAA